MSDVYCIHNSTNDSLGELSLSSSLTSLASLSMFTNTKQHLAPISTPLTNCTAIDDISPSTFLLGASPMVTSLTGLNTSEAETPSFMDPEPSNTSTPNPPTASPNQI